MTYRLNETSGHGSMVTINVPSLHRCAEMCRGMLCWVQCKAALVAVRSFDGCGVGCGAKLCWVRCKTVWVQWKAVMADLQELRSC